MKIYNTLTGKKEEFKTNENGTVRMYVCGPTVYDYIHIGNARPMIVFDAFRRYLEFKGYKVIYVSNFTDIDDKIIKKAIENNSTQEKISKQFIEECKKDMHSLDIKEATYNPLATDEIKDMIKLISSLIEKGFAYKVKDGTVYFDTSKFKEYGKLSHKNIDELRSGERDLKISGEENKNNITDFVLWKPKKEGEPYWDSPFCEGRPGWHTECCVMAPKYCNGPLDIHAGGEDLIFPHHENEIAQYESLNNKEYSKYWMHNAFLNINNKKMSKSLGNFLTVRELLNISDGNTLRFLILSCHYRLMLNFNLSDDENNSLKQAKAGYERIENTINNILFLLKNNNININKNENMADLNEFNLYLSSVKEDKELSSEEKENLNFVFKQIDIYFKKLDDDFNTPDAITAVFEIVKIANQSIKENSNTVYLLSLYQIIKCLISVLGFKSEDNSNDIEEDIKKLITEREEARKNKDFKKADEIRNILLSKGIEIEDTRQGVKVKKIK